MAWRADLTGSLNLEQRDDNHTSLMKLYGYETCVSMLSLTYSKSDALSPCGAYTYRGMCYKKLGNFEESVKDYTNAIRLESNNGNFYYNRAISYMCLNPPDYEKALEDYDLAVKLSQAKYRPLFNRGNCLRKMGRIAESIVDLKQVLSRSCNLVMLFTRMRCGMLEMRPDAQVPVRAPCPSEL
jgi:tetratricopeptide (TPR) repeat protein